jgi:hypothetical protein
MGGAIVIRQMKALLSLDAAGFDKGLDGAESRLDRFGQKMRSWGASMTAAVTLPLIAAGTAFVKWASDVQEATSAATQVYGAGADAIIAKSKEAAETVFLSEGDYLAAAATLGVYGKAAGLTGDELAAFGHSNIQAAADLASFYNISGGVPAVLEAIQGALMGEYDALQRMGVLIDETIVNDYAWSHGIAEVGAELTEQQKVLARHGVIMEGLGPAQGDAARTAGGLANQIRKLQAQFKNIGATIGKILLPVAMKLVGVVADLFSWAEKISPSMLKWAVIIAAVVAAIGPLLFALGVFAPGLALLLSPIGLVVAALAGLAVVFRGPLGDALDKARTSIGYVDDAFRAFRANGVRPIEAALLALGTAFEALTGINISGWLSSLGTALDGVVAAVRTIFSVGFDEAIGVLAANIQAAFGNDALTGAVVNGIQFFKNVIDGEWAAAWESYKGYMADVGTILVTGSLALAETIWEGAGNLWEWVKRKLGVGTFQVGDATGGPGMVQTITLGDVLVDGVLKLGETIGAWAGNLWGWLKGKLGVGTFGVGDGTGGPAMVQTITLGDVLIDGAMKLAGEMERWAGNIWGWVHSKLVTTVGGEGGVAERRTVRLGTWSLDLPPPETGVTGPVVVGWIDESLEQIIGIDVELQTWTLDLANPQSDLTLLDVTDWVDTMLEGIVGVDVELQTWKLSLNNPTNDLTLLDVVNWVDQAIENLAMVDVELQDWHLSFEGPNSDLSLADVIGWVDDILEAIIGVDVELQNWNLELGMPNISLGFSVPEFWNKVWNHIDNGNTMGGGGQPPGGGHAGSGASGGLGFHGPVMGSVLGAANALSGDQTGGAAASPFAALTGSAQDAATKITAATLAIESRVTAMAGVVTTMAFNAGDGALAGLRQGFDAAAALVTTITLGLEARLTGFAGVATVMGVNAGDGWDAGVAQGMQAGGAVVTNVTLGLESRLTAFAGAATVAGFNAGDGFFAGIDQGMGRAVGAAESGAGQITGALSFDLSGEGYWIGASLAQGIASGINGWAVVVANAAYAIVAGAIAAARLAGGIFSPSRPMGYIGDMLMAGLFAPIRDGQAEMSRLMGGVLGAATGAPVPGFAPRLAPMGALSGLGGRSEQRPVVNNYYISDNVIGDDAEAWIARVSVRSVVPAVGKALDQERRAQGMR